MSYFRGPYLGQYIHQSRNLMAEQVKDTGLSDSVCVSVGLSLPLIYSQETPASQTWSYRHSPVSEGPAQELPSLILI